MNENLSDLELELKNETEKLTEHKKTKEKLTKEAMILKAKLQEEKLKQKQQMQKIKEKLRNDIRKAESYFAFILLRAIENLDDKTQEEMANILYKYILKLQSNNKKEVARAKQYTEIMKFSNKTIYITLSKLLGQNQSST